MHSAGHPYNGYVSSILGTVLHVITGNLDVPGGVIGTELVKSDKGGSPTGKQFLGRQVRRTVNGKGVEGKQEELHVDGYGDWAAGWGDVIGDHPRRFLKSVTLKYKPFRGYRYPIKSCALATRSSQALTPTNGSRR